MTEPDDRWPYTSSPAGADGWTATTTRDAGTMSSPWWQEIGSVPRPTPAFDPGGTAWSAGELPPAPTSPPSTGGAWSSTPASRPSPPSTGGAWSSAPASRPSPPSTDGAWSSAGPGSPASAHGGWAPEAAAPGAPPSFAPGPAPGLVGPADGPSAAYAPPPSPPSPGTGVYAPGPSPAYGGAPPGPYGAGPRQPPAAYAPPPPPPPPPPGTPRVRHRPGLGLVVGVAGLVALVLSLTVLPWISAGGQDATFADIGDALDTADRVGRGTPSTTDTLDSGDTSDGGDLTTTTLPPPDPTTTTFPGADDLTDVTPPTFGLGGQTPTTAAPLGPAVEPPGVEPTSPSTAPEVPAPSSTIGTDYLDWYTSWIWIVVVGYAAAAVLFATLLVPASKGGRMVTGFLSLGFFGMLLHLADDEGSVAPRVCGALIAMVALVAHGIAVFDLFYGDDIAPDPAPGVWVGVGGLVTVLVGCVLGTRTERVAALSRS